MSTGTGNTNFERINSLTFGLSDNEWVSHFRGALQDLIYQWLSGKQPLVVQFHAIALAVYSGVDISG